MPPWIWLQWPDYKPTPLVELPEVAAACGVKRVLYKDESHRFGLQSFKALGAIDLIDVRLLKGCHNRMQSICGATEVLTTH